jgi:hypothetical protein
MIHIWHSLFSMWLPPERVCRIQNSHHQQLCTGDASMLARGLYFLQFSRPTIQPNITPSVTGTGEHTDTRRVELPPLHNFGETERGGTRHITLSFLMHELLPKYQVPNNIKTSTSAYHDLAPPMRINISQRTNILKPTFPSALGYGNQVSPNSCKFFTPMTLDRFP